VDQPTAAFLTLAAVGLAGLPLASRLGRTLGLAAPPG